jgi:hypothetical protein
MIPVLTERGNHGRCCTDSNTDAKSNTDTTWAASPARGESS